MKLCVSWDETVRITGFVCTHTKQGAVLSRYSIGLVIENKLRTHTLQARCGTFLTNETGLTKVVELERRILETVKEICSDDLRIGGYKLWLMLINMYGRHHVSGRNRFFAILRRKGLLEDLENLENLEDLENLESPAPRPIPAPPQENPPKNQPEPLPLNSLFVYLHSKP